MVQDLNINYREDISRGLVLNALLGAQVIDPDNATLLGSTIGNQCGLHTCYIGREDWGVEDCVGDMIQ